MQSVNQRPGPAPGTPAEEDWLADLPQEPAARLTVLEQRRTTLFRAMRECDRAIQEARRTPSAPAPQPTPEASLEDPARDTSEEGQDIRAAETEQPEAVEDEAPVPVPPVPTPTDVDEVDFSRILSEPHEREYLRLIFREAGKPTTAQVRVVLGNRMELVVQDKINERARDILGDVLFYEEDGRLVVTEEFEDNLKRFLNDRDSGLRQI